MTWSELVDLSVDNVPCPYCHAAPGLTCRVVRGRTTGTPTPTHTARTEVAWEAWRNGFREGARDGHESAFVAVERRLAGAHVVLNGALSAIPVDTLVAQLRAEASRWLP